MGQLIAAQSQPQHVQQQLYCVSIQWDSVMLLQPYLDKEMIVWW